MATTLQRTAFKTSRLLEYFSERELTLQLGAPRAAWPLALLKELIDNALDAAESRRVPPAIAVTVDRDALTIADNGPGLPLATIKGALDYSVRVSDKRGYVAPTRGQLGNALKCLFAAPFVSDGAHGRVVVATGGARHQIDITLDRIKQVPVPALTSMPDPAVKNGTCITMAWPNIASFLTPDEDDEASYFYRGGVIALLCDYATLNPHATFQVHVPYAGNTLVVFPASDRGWRRWGPGDPTSAHWYTPGDLGELVAHYLTVEGARPRRARDFVREFDGLSATARARDVLTEAGLTGTTLADLASGGDLDRDAIARLLAAMRAAARPVAPSRLGVIGKAHLAASLARDHEAAPERIHHTRRMGATSGAGGATALPYVLEVAFAVVAPDDGDEYATRRRVVIGLNHSPAPPSAFGRVLEHALSTALVDAHDPAVLVVSLVCPRLPIHSHAKGSVALPPDLAAALAAAVGDVTKAWKAAARRKDKERRMQAQSLDRLRRRARGLATPKKDHAYRVMAEAYAKVSNDGLLPANARQIMYVARDLVLAIPAPLWEQDSTFTQVYLPDYEREHPEETATWDVVYDARGHLTEPHTGRTLGLGTLEVRNYAQAWGGRLNEPDFAVTSPYTTTGPEHRYRHALFIEKEGFMPLLEHARIAERYDLAIMSSKGMSTTAARRMVDALSLAGVTILCLHDFDKSGLEILASLRNDNRRHTFIAPPRVIDLGLRLDDIRRLGLRGEPVGYRTKDPHKQKDPREHLRRCGATAEECAFLVSARDRTGYTGERVELNALTSQQFLDFLEAKLAALGVAKVTPDAEVLARTYDHARRLAAAERAARQALGALPAGTFQAPADLAARIQAALAEDPAASWDAAVARLARAEHEGA